MEFEELQPLFGIEEALLTIAGPCSAESREQVTTTADELKAFGIKIFRAGVWKPRTKPGSFEGIGSEALEWLKEVREQTGMKVITEVATARHLEEAIASGVDGIWLGARTSANPFAVQEIADALAALDTATRERITVLVKNPVNPDLELWIGALERIYSAGVRRLGAIHRGFSSYGKHLYRNPPKWRIPIELHRRMPKLPILCDPSHIGGRRELIAGLCQEAIDMNFNGLIIESHCNPERALSDSEQQLTPKDLAVILKGLTHRGGISTNDELRELRAQIDRVDDELIELLAKRMRISEEIGAFKKRHDMAVVQPERYNSLMDKRVAAGKEIGLSEEFMRNILTAIHEESVRKQVEC